MTGPAFWLVYGPLMSGFLVLALIACVAFSGNVAFTVKHHGWRWSEAGWSVLAVVGFFVVALVVETLRSAWHSYRRDRRRASDAAGPDDIEVEEPAPARNGGAVIVALCLISLTLGVVSGLAGHPHFALYESHCCAEPSQVSGGH